MPGLSWSQPLKRMPYQFYNQAVSSLPPWQTHLPSELAGLRSSCYFDSPPRAFIGSRSTPSPMQLPDQWGQEKHPE